MNSPIATMRKRREARELKAKELKLVFGEQDMLDVMSYASLEETPDYINLDGVFLRTLYINGYPFVANSGWLDSLINFNHDTDISYHVTEVSALLALPKLHRKITELESTKRAMIRAGKIVGSEVTDPLESAIELRDKIQRGQEKLFQMSIYVTLRADSLEELNKTTKLLEATLSARLFYSKVARYQQIAD